MTDDRTVQEWVMWQRTAYATRRHFLRGFIFGQICARLLWKVTAEGVDYVPRSGPAVIMMSHSTLADITVPLGVIKHRFVVPMSKRENFEKPPISWITRSWGAVPVNRGEVDRRALQTTIELLQSGELVLMMPEGTRTPALQEAKDGLTYILLKADVVVIPAAVWGLEQFAEDLLRPWRRSDVHIRFGQPFRLETGGRQRVPRDEMARMTQEMMYRLSALYPEHKRGYYSDLSQATTEYLNFT